MTKTAEAICLCCLTVFLFIYMLFIYTEKNDSSLPDLLSPLQGLPEVAVPDHPLQVVQIPVF